MPRQDAELLASARAGDQSAVDELLSRYEKQIYRFGLRMCGTEADARDVLQETLIAAFKNLPEFRGDAELSTWLYQIARSFCTKSRRRRVGEPADKGSLDSSEVRGLPSADQAPDAAAHARQIGEVLQAAIRALPDRQREIVILKDVEGLSAEEAAKVLGEDVAAVKSRLHRARLELRASITALLGAEGQPSAGSPCPELADELAAYASEELDQAACQRIEEHLARCSRCSSACEDLKQSVSLCRRIPGDAVPAPVQTAVRRALRTLTGAPA